MNDTDEFSAALEGAITGRTEDEDGDAPFLGDAPADAPAAPVAVKDQGGGDIDDGPRFEQARQIEAKVQQAEQTKAQWASHFQEQEGRLKAAQEAHRAARKKVMEDESEDALAKEDEALQAVLDARAAVDRARDGYAAADRYRAEVAATPRLSDAEQGWLQRHPEYLSDNRFAGEANRIMQQLIDRGLNARHPAFYQELDNELRVTPRMGQQSRRTPGAPAVRTDSRTTPAANGEVMTRAEAGFIRQLGRDPGDKQVQAQWLASKANTRKVAQSRGSYR